MHLSSPPQASAQTKAAADGTLAALTDILWGTLSQFVHGSVYARPGPVSADTALLGPPFGCWELLLILPGELIAL